MQPLFHLIPLSWVMITLISIIGVIIARFSWRYMQGDSRFRLFYMQLAALIASLLAMVSADNIWLFAGLWCASNLLLVRLMIHNAKWKQAMASGMLAGWHLMLGTASLVIAFVICYELTGSHSIQEILTHEALASHPFGMVALLCLLFTAMAQSALIPLHKWLLSSLNSPTPVSALMHAGLVNGGGFLLALFAPLFLQRPELLLVMLAVGTLSAWLGTTWKLMQPSVKPMLACSTLGQMGFMVLQCGLGLFSAAVAHLCWHGMFKAYLFLASGNAAQEKRMPAIRNPKLANLLLATACGALAAYGFALMNGIEAPLTDTRALLLLLAGIAGAQLALVTLHHSIKISTILTAMFTSVVAGLVYGGSVALIKSVLEPMGISMPQPLAAPHGIIAAIMVLAWLAMLYGQKVTALLSEESRTRHYVRLMKASQPHPDTITTYRNDYQY